MKIILLSHKFYPAIGGIETTSELLAHSFTKAGHKVHVVTWSKDETRKDFPYKVIRNPRLQELFQEYSWCDIVFENNPCLRLAWPNLIFGRPSIVVLQTWLAKANEKVIFPNKLKRLWLKRARSVIAISDAVRQNDWPTATVIGNTYDVDNFKIIPGLHRNNGFVFVGRLVSDKGADLAIKALRNLTIQLRDEGSQNKKYSLTIIGDGPDRVSLEDLVDDLQLRDCVKFTGALRGPELARCLNQHQFLLVPSLWEEPFGIVALEGMACGCVPIVSDGGGLPEAVGNGGLTFSRGDIVALVRCMKKLLNNSLLEQQLRNAANDHLMAYQPSVITQKYLDTIESTVTSL